MVDVKRFRVKPVVPSAGPNSAKLEILHKFGKVLDVKEI